MDIREKARPKMHCTTISPSYCKTGHHIITDIGAFQLLFLMNSGLLDWMVERKIFGQSMRRV